MDTLIGKAAIVIGASSGISEGIARMLAAEGARVALSDRRGGYPPGRRHGSSLPADLRVWGKPGLAQLTYRFTVKAR